MKYSSQDILIALTQVANIEHASSTLKSLAQLSMKLPKLRRLSEGFVHLLSSAFESSFFWKSDYLKFKHYATKKLQKEVMNHKLLPLDI